MASKIFKFPTTGIEIKVRKVSQQVMSDVASSLPTPRPPMQEVELDGVKKLEPNPAHPDYLAALQAHQMELLQLTNRLLVQLGVDYRLTPEDESELETVLSVMRENGVTPTGKTKLEQWVYYVAVVKAEDLSALVEEVLSLGQPTPKSD